MRGIICCSLALLVVGMSGPAMVYTMMKKDPLDGPEKRVEVNFDTIDWLTIDPKKEDPEGWAKLMQTPYLKESELTAWSDSVRGRIFEQEHGYSYVVKRSD